MNAMTPADNALHLDASEAARKIRAGLLTSVQLVTACLERIEQTDGQLKAWVHLEPERALADAAEMDAIRQAGRPIGALHGVPVGLKDIVDTRNYPTERGSRIFAGRKPDRDAAIVERLCDAGAIILGKTATTEVAFVHPAATRNPHDLEHTPGGSSSGSAAAVAAYQVPLAIGTQTNGSVIRPASFCGTYGFKPTRGIISRRGVLATSKTLDQLGVFARSLEDTALLVDVLKGYDQTDSMSFARPRPKMLKGCNSTAPVDPCFAWFDLPFDDRLSEDSKAGFEELLSTPGVNVERLSSPAAFTGMIGTQKTIHEYEICRHLEETFDSHWDQISATLKPVIERARAITEADYLEALSTAEAACAYFDAFFKDFDAILTPGATGEAPKIGPTTGDPIFCTLWTLAGLPSISVPLMVGANGLPVGVQLVGAAEEDDRLLRTTNWLLKTLNDT